MRADGEGFNFVKKSMNLTNQKILVTGGSSGIGLELSKQLLRRKNQVIICGSTPEKLQSAVESHPRLISFRCDLSQPDNCKTLIEWIREHHRDLSVLVNNAAIVHKASFFGGTDMLAKAEREMQVNFFAPLRLIHGLAPILVDNQNPAVINITTGLVYAPRADYSFYNSTKAALHAFTQVLRIQTAPERLKVIEVLFPAVDTPWHQGQAPEIAIAPEEAVSAMLKEIDRGKEEIKVKGVKLLHLLSRLAPDLALKKVNDLG